MKSPFRSLRQTLFNEGKLLRYLGYAIGEVLLIIVGILMALKINDWNEDRKAQAEFDAYVVQLKADVETAMGNTRETIAWTKDQIAFGHTILEVLAGENHTQGEMEAFEEALNLFHRTQQPQIRVGLLGKLMDGDTQVIGRDSELAQIAMKLESELEADQYKFGSIHDSIVSRRSKLDTYVARGHELYPKIKLRYHLDALKASTEFGYTIQNIALKYADVVLISEAVLEKLESFLTVLEEYE